MMSYTKTMSWKTKLIAVALGALIMGGVIFFVFKDEPNPGSSTIVDNTITETIDESKQFETEVNDHAVETITKTVIIREQVVAQVAALDNDALADALINEIYIWRGTSADKTAPRSTELYND